MTQMQFEETMKNVRWKTMLYIGFTAGSILLAISGMYYGLKGDIRESTYTSTLHYLSLDRKIDSLHYVTEDEIRSIKSDLNKK